MLEREVMLSVSSYWSRPHSSHPRKKRRRKPVLKLLLKKLKQHLLLRAIVWDPLFPFSLLLSPFLSQPL